MRLTEWIGVFIVVVAVLFCSWGWRAIACIDDDNPDPRDGATTINNGGSGGAGGQGGAGGAGGSASASSSSGATAGASAATGPVTQTVNISGAGSGGKNKFEAKRPTVDVPTAGGPADARFREDQRYEPDWRVFAVASILARQKEWEYQDGVKLSANLDKSKMHKNLLRVMEQKTSRVVFSDGAPVPAAGDQLIFLGWIPMTPDLKRGGLIAWLSSDGPNDQTAFNLIGNQVVAGCEAGATHLVPVKEGFIRGGHSEVDFIGLAGGGSSIFEDGTKRGGGVSGSVGPSTTKMDAWDVDRPYMVMEAWCLVSEAKKNVLK